MKVNSDASFIATSSLAAAGVIARNSDGEVLFSAGWILPECSDAEEAEGQAMLLGMQTLEKIYVGSTIFETDCAAVVEALNAKSVIRPRWWATYNDSLELLKNSPSWRVTKIGRESNVAAHKLAAYARSNGSFFMMGSVPCSITDVIFKDCNPGKSNI